MKKKFLTRSNLLELFLKYKTGLEVMKVLEISKSTLWRYCKKFNISDRMEERSTLFRNLKGMGYTVDEVAKKTGYSKYVVRRHL